MNVNNVIASCDGSLKYDVDKEKTILIHELFEQSCKGFEHFYVLKHRTEYLVYQ